MATNYSLFVQKQGDPTVYGVDAAGQFTGFQNPDQAFAAGVAKDFSNVQQRGSELQIPQGTLTGSGTPLGTPLSTDQLTNNQQQVNLSNTLPKTNLDNASSTVAGASAASKSIEQYIKELTPPASPEKQAYQSILDEISGLTGKQEQKGEDTLKAQEAAGLKQKQQELLNFQNEMNVKAAEYDQLKQSYDQLVTENQARPVTLGTIQGENANILFARQQALNQKASEIGLVQAKVTAAQGNLSLAQQQVTNAVNLKYDSINAQLNTKLAQLDAIAPILNKQEQIFANALKLKYEEEQQSVAVQKNQEVNNINFALKAGITSRYYNYLGEVRDSVSGHAFSSAQEFFAASGVTSFDEAYQQGTLTDYSPTTTSDLSASDTEIATVGGRKVLINSVTGETIRDLGSSTSPGDPVDEDQKIIKVFNKALDDANSEIIKGNTREAVIAKLQRTYPEIDAGDIARAVYEAYPDSYVNRYNKIEE